MEILPYIFRKTSDEFITKPPMKRFIRTHKIDIKGKPDQKEELWSAIQEFAEHDENNESIFMDWLDNRLREGIKEIKVKKIRISSEMQIICGDIDALNQHISTYLCGEQNCHFAGQRFGRDLCFFRYQIQTLKRNTVVSLYFCKMVTEVNLKKSEASDFEFPVVVDIFLEDGWYVIRYKSKGKFYEYHPEILNLMEKQKYSLSQMSLLKMVDTEVKRMLPFELIDTREASYTFKQKLYRILKQYTDTPPEVKAELDQNTTTIDHITDEIMGICHLAEQNRENVRSDIQNLVEKHLSIHWPRPDDFIQGRDAYPIQLSATDDEESHVDQTAGEDTQPLQTKEVFYDNKRMIENDKMCDGIKLMYKRKDRTYYDARFPVCISEINGVCTLKFSHYTEEEDINHVLFSIMDA